MPSPTHYEVLGVEPDASAEAVRAAYRRKARELHPDVNSNPDTILSMVAVNQAYAILGDPVARKEYDRTRRLSCVSAATDASTWEDTYRFIDSLGHEQMTGLTHRFPCLLHDHDLWRSLWKQAVEAQRAQCVPFDADLAFEFAVARYQSVLAPRAGT